MATSEVATSSQAVPIALNLVAAVIGAGGQYAYKAGAAKLSTTPIFKNGTLFAGVFAFCIVMGMFVASFKMGGRLSVVYPMYATTFLWGTLLGIVVDKEPWSGLQVAGAVVTMLGISLVAYGAPGR